MEPLNIDWASLGIDPSLFAAAVPAAAPEAPAMPAAQTATAPTPAPVAPPPTRVVQQPQIQTPGGPTADQLRAYDAANADLRANWDSGGIMRQLGGTYEDALAAHLQRTGLAEMASGARAQIPGLAASPVTTAAPAAPAAAPSGSTALAANTPMRTYIDPNTGKSVTSPALETNKKATWADLYAANPQLQEWAKNAMQGEFAPSGWGGGVIDSLEEATNYWQQTYGDGGTGIQFATVAPPSAFAFDPAKGNIEALRLGDGVVDVSKLTNPEVKSVLNQAAQTPLASAPPPSQSSNPFVKSGYLQFDDPTLKPAGGQYETPYYAAYTNDNDFAGAVMAAPGQKIRLVDQTNGEVVYEGEGQAGAKMATDLANAASQSKGREAAWAIQVDQQGSWTTAAAERYDPEKQSFFGKLMDIVLPIAGALLMPVTGGMSAALTAGLGAAGGSAVSSLAQGRDLESTLKMAALSGLGAGVVGPAAGKFIGSLGNGASIIPGSDQLLSATIPGAVTGVAAPGVVSGLSTLYTQAAMSPALQSMLGEFVAMGMTPAAAQAAVQTLAANAGTAIGAGAGAIAGSGAATPKPGTQNADGSTNVSEVVVTPSRAATGTDGLALTDISGAVLPAVFADQVAPLPSKVEGLQNAPQISQSDLSPGLLDQLKTLVGDKLNPKDLLGLAAMLGGALASGGGGAGGGGGSGSGNGLGGGANIANAGTRASLSPIFSAQLPAAKRGTRTATPQDMSLSGWHTYGITGPEASFFSNVPQADVGVSGLAANVAKLPDAQIGDRNGDGRIDAIDRMLFAAAIGRAA